MATKQRLKSAVGSLLFVIVSICLTSQSIARDWPAFRGPTRDGMSPAVGVPVEWSPSENIVWKQPVPGIGWSSPVWVDGKIYLTTATGSAEEENISLRVLCLDQVSGEVVWDVEAIRPASDAAGRMHSKNSLASPTVVVDGDRLFAHFGHMGTAALNLAGEVLWKQTELGYSPTHGNGGSPAVVGNLLVFSADGDDTQQVIALDRETGNVEWQTPRSDTAVERKFSFSTPTVIEIEGQTQIISPGSGYVAAYDPADGREIWRVTYGDGFSVVPRPVWANGLLYVATGFMRASVLAINPREASGDVTGTHVEWRHDQGVPTTPSLLVAGSEIYFVSDRGVATCLDAFTGEEHWTQRLGGGFSASPVYAENRIYFTSEDGVTYVVRAGTEYEQLAKNELEERTLASPAVDDGAIYLRTEGHLWRIGE
jgi:outer membrane protein assembly factor BamB